jgi:hypothetical protein
VPRLAEMTKGEVVRLRRYDTASELQQAGTRQAQLGRKTTVAMAVARAVVLTLFR